LRVVKWEQLLGFLEVALASALRESVVSERMRPKTLRLWEPLALLPEQLVRVSSQQERDVPETGLTWVWEPMQPPSQYFRKTSQK